MTQDEILIPDSVKEFDVNEVHEPEMIEGMPVIALRGLVVFPNSSVQFDIGRKKSMEAIDAALKGDRRIFLVAQEEIRDKDPDYDRLYDIGTICTIKQVLKQSDSSSRLLVDGIMRGRLEGLKEKTPYLSGNVVPIPDEEDEKSVLSEAYIRRAKNLFEEYVKNFQRMSNEVILDVMTCKTPGRLADSIASNTYFDYEVKQLVLENIFPLERLRILIEIMENEIDVINLENELARLTKDRMDKQQREYFLREQMHTIALELGDEDSPMEEADELRKKLKSLHLKESSYDKMSKEIDRLSKMPQSSHEYSVQRAYIDTVLDLPWNKFSKIKTNLPRARKILDRDHYGLDKVKERIVETLAVQKLNEDIGGQIICLVGPPGVGKTSIARSVAEATGRKYQRISLGGIRDESEIVGHRRTYVGAMQGRIISAIKQAGTSNPLILLDEIDKLCSDIKGDPSAALLQALDPEQNIEFYDHYIDVPFDLSKVLFMTTANDSSTIPAPLLDRMDVINLSSYTQEEKVHIATKHLLPKQIKKHGLTRSQLKIASSAMNEIIQSYTTEAGVRNLERQIANICRKVAAEVVENPEVTVSITKKNIEEYLGPKKFHKDKKGRKSQVGLVNGLAWTSVGGEMLPIEVAVMDGTGKLELTGNLGQVMQESAKTAYTCVRTRANSLGIPSDFYSKKDIHIHVPEGAIPKDGPSAGIAMGTAIASALTGIKVRHDVAMTGEITLLGNVLPIGGLKEKTMAAYKDGIKDVIIPKDNEPDLSEIDKVVAENIEFHTVEDLDEVLDLAFVKKPQHTSGTAAM